MLEQDNAECLTTSSRGSQIARLLKQIEDEQTAARRGMTDFAEGAARHKFINARLQRMGEYCDQLTEVVGDRDQTMTLVVMHLSSVWEEGALHV